MTADPGTDRQTSVTRPAADVYSGPDAVEIVVDLPGVRREDVRLSIQEDDLLLDARVVGLGDGELVGRVGLPRRYRRLFGVPRGVDGDRIRARMRNGVLRVSLPKSGGAESRAIPVEEE